jgi:hypothetical protein
LLGKKLNMGINVKHNQFKKWFEIKKKKQSKEQRQNLKDEYI